MQTWYRAWPAGGGPASGWTVALVAEAAASVRLVHACQRLDDLRLTALAGGPYDPDEYDAAIWAYRAAQAAAARATALLAARLRREHAGPAA